MSLVLASLPKQIFGSPRGRRTIPAFMSPFESGNVRWLTPFIKPRLLPEEKITEPRGFGRITIQTTTVPSSSTRTATTSKSFVTKHLLNPLLHPPPRAGEERGGGLNGLNNLNILNPTHEALPVKIQSSLRRECPSLGGAHHDLNQSPRRQHGAYCGAGRQIGSI